MGKKNERTANSPQAPMLEAVRALYGAMERFDSCAAGSLGVDRTALRALNLMERGPVSPGRVGEALALTSGAVTALLQRLERAGHIERTDTADGRRRDARLTPAGRKAAHREFERLGRNITTRFGDHSPAQLQQLREAIQLLAEAFDAAGGAGR